MDGVVLVIRSFSTRPEQVTSSIERLHSSRVDLLGTVLTRERSRRRRREHEYSADLTRDRAELPLSVETAVDRDSAVPDRPPPAPAETNGVALKRVTIDTGAGCDR
jgi:Mrp family chromosome partitioning ATPase